MKRERTKRKEVDWVDFDISSFRESSFGKSLLCDKPDGNWNSSLVVVMLSVTLSQPLLGDEVSCELKEGMEISAALIKSKVSCK
jgi:hypothetical protein